MFRIEICTDPFSPSGRSSAHAHYFAALGAGAWQAHWVYWIAPIVGAASAAILYKMVFSLEK